MGLSELRSQLISLPFPDQSTHRRLGIAMFVGLYKLGKLDTSASMSDETYRSTPVGSKPSLRRRLSCGRTQRGR